MRFPLSFALALACVAGLFSGCQQGADSLPPEPVLYPAIGKVTVQGQPLGPRAVITFLQVDEKGTTSVGETDDEGRFEMKHVGKPGVSAAKYKVAISYLVGGDGTVYGLAPRSGLAKPYGLVTAKELLPPEWSDLGTTTHQVEVPQGGGSFDFDIKEALLPPPTPTESPAPATPVETPTANPESAPAPASEPPSPGKAAEDKREPDGG